MSIVSKTFTYRFMDAVREDMQAVGVTEEDA